MISRVKYAKGFPLALLAALIAPPVINHALGNGTDANIQWFFNAITVNSHWEVVPTIFPHGPLAFLQYPMAMAWIPMFMLVLNLAVKWSLISAYLTISKHYYSEKWKDVIGLILFVGVGTLVPFYLQFFLLGTLLALLLLKEHNLKNYLAFSVVTGLSIFIKADIAVYSILLHTIIVVRTLSTGKWISVLFGIGIWFVSGIVVYAFQFGLEYAALSYEYVIGLYHLIVGNGAAMTLVDDPMMWQVVAGIIVIIFIQSRWYRKHVIWETSLLLLPLMASWKHGVVRLDHYHASGFVDSMVIFWILMFVISGGLRECINLFVSALFSVGIIALSFSVSVYGFDAFSPIKATPLNYVSYSKSLAPEPMPNYQLESINADATIDVIPKGFHYVWQSNLTPLFKPVIQTYAANTTWLDKKVADHLIKASPDYILWHTDEDGRFVSIDDRSSWSDTPITLDVVNKHYSFRAMEKNALILKKDDPKPDREKTELAAYQTELFTWQEAKPSAGTWLLVDAEIEYKSIWSQLEALAYRKKPLYYQIMTTSGDIETYRMPSVLTNRSIMVSHDYSIENDSIFLSQEIDRWRIIADTHFYDPTVSITTYQTEMPSWYRETKNVSTLNFNASKNHETVTEGGFNTPLITLMDSAIAMRNWCKVVAYAFCTSSNLPNAQLVLKAMGETESIEHRTYLNAPFLSTDGSFVVRAEIELDAEEMKKIRQFKCSIWNASESQSIDVNQMYLTIQSY